MKIIYENEEFRIVGYTDNLVVSLTTTDCFFLTQLFTHLKYLLNNIII